MQRAFIFGINQIWCTSLCTKSDWSKGLRVDGRHHIVSSKIDKIQLYVNISIPMINVQCFVARHFKDSVIVLVYDNPSFELIVGTMPNNTTIFALVFFFLSINKFKLMSTCEKKAWKKAHTLIVHQFYLIQTQQIFLLATFTTVTWLRANHCLRLDNILSHESIDWWIANRKEIKKKQSNNTKYQKLNRNLRITSNLNVFQL